MSAWNRKIDPVQLARMVGEGHSNAYMAEHFQVRRDTVVEARRLIGLRSNEPSARPKYDYERIVALTKDGYSAAEISREIGCSKETVRRTRVKFGVSQGRTMRKYSQEIRDKALVMLEDGASYNEVGRTLGVPDKWVRKTFPGMGWTRQQVYEYRALKKQLDSLA